MPELPDITIYIERLEARIKGKVIENIRLLSFFLLRSVDPPLAAFHGKPVLAVSRMGKRIVFHFPDERFLVLHLMVAGRLHWKEHGAAIPKGRGLAAFDFPDGTLLLTEEGSKKRASLHAVTGSGQLAELDPGGLEVITATAGDFITRLRSENHTLKRALTDPHLFSGIGNAYSDEILHRAKLSPILLTAKISDDDAKRLFDAMRNVLDEWTERLRRETGDGFPAKVTAFRQEMAAHGKYEQPCPVCGTPIQRIRYAENETDYCPGCQTGGKLLADRALSRLLKGDWPSSVDELEAMRKKK